MHFYSNFWSNGQSNVCWPASQTAAGALERDVADRRPCRPRRVSPLPPRRSGLVGPSRAPRPHSRCSVHPKQAWEPAPVCIAPSPCAAPGPACAACRPSACTTRSSPRVRTPLLAPCGFTAWQAPPIKATSFFWRAPAPRSQTEPLRPVAIGAVAPSLTLYSLSSLADTSTPSVRPHRS
jgi:hypothetical protein